MKDNITNFPLNNIDMSKIKGQTVIELRDAKSGEIVQKTKDDNMLTKALEYFYANGGMSNPSAFGASGIRTDALAYLLGGILCLDTALTESDTIVRVPAGVKMTANAAKGVLNSGNPPELGSWNENESGWAQDGSYKMVYDFNTSQGNGTIACVCLTSKLGGHQGIGNASDTWQTNSTNFAAYNSTTAITTGGNQKLGFYNNSYFAINETSLDGLTEVTVKEYALPVTEIDVRDKTSGREKNSYTVALPNALKNLSGGWNIIALFSRNGVATLLIGQNANYQYPWGSKNPGVYVTTFNMSTKTFGSVISITATGTYLNTWGITDQYAVLNGQMINLSNTVDVSDITDNIGAFIDPSTFQGTPRVYEAIDSKVLYGILNSSGDKAFRIDLQNKTVLFINSGENIEDFGVTANDLIRCYPTYVVRDPRYIASINNLENAITKDASKTMKVTYILRFDVEEE